MPPESAATGPPAPAADVAEERAGRPGIRLRQRIDADRLARLGSLTAAAVHGLRNPLVSVKSFLQLVSDRYDDVEFRERFRRLAARELARVEELLDDLATLARDRGAASAELAPAVAAAGRLLHHYARANGSEIRVEAPRPARRVALGPTDLEHLLVALGMYGLAWGGRGSQLRLEVADPASAGSERAGSLEIRVRCLPGGGVRSEGESLPDVIRLIAARGGGSVATEAAGGALDLRVRLPATG